VNTICVGLSEIRGFQSTLDIDRISIVSLFRRANQCSSGNGLLTSLPGIRSTIVAWCVLMTDEGIEAVDQMANLVTAWRQSLDPDDGFLRIYVD